MFSKWVGIGILVLGLCSLGNAADIPGGLTTNGEGLRTNTYQMLLKPSYEAFSGTGSAYLTSQINFQASDDFGIGLGFGAGELGFNLGMNGIWYVLPDTATQPAFAILGGVYFNRFSPSNYFVVKAAPIVSKSVKTSFGRLVPYAGLHLTPSFRLGQANNVFSMKTSMGTEFVIKSLNGLHLWMEGDVGLVQSPEEVVLGVSYPFNGI